MREYRIQTMMQGHSPQISAIAGHNDTLSVFLSAGEDRCNVIEDGRRGLAAARSHLLEVTHEGKHLLVAVFSRCEVIDVTTSRGKPNVRVGEFVVIFADLTAQTLVLHECCTATEVRAKLLMATVW